MAKVERIKLYHYPATRSARVKWLLHEVLGEDFDVERVDLYQGVQYQAKFLELNPNHAVPTLELRLSDGTQLNMIESGAMISWLADAFPEKGLAPVADGLSPERADYLQILHFASTPMDMMLWQIRIHEHVLPADQRDPRTLARYRAKFRDEVEPQLERRLSSHAYICGEHFCAADCAMGHAVLWARLYGLCQGQGCAAYAERLMARPAFQAAFADLQEFAPEPGPDSRLANLFTG